jgi:hypothetical protein
MNATISTDLGFLRNELTSWYISLDDRNEYIFERVYEHDSRVLVDALGGFGVTAQEIGLYPTLRELLGVDSDATDADPAAGLPHVFGSSPPVTEPASAAENQAFKVQWVDINYGGPTLGYEDVVQIFDGSSTARFQGRVERGALDHGAQASVEIDVPGLPAGTYRLEIIHNAAGGDAQYPEYSLQSVGLRSITETELTVSAAAGE